MDSLVNKFGRFQLNGGVGELQSKTFGCYLSEIISPSRLYAHIHEPQIKEIDDGMKIFYSIEENSDSFQLRADQVRIGLKVAVRACKQWHRGEIIGNLSESGTVCVFMIDYGTSGYIYLENCKILLEEFNKYKRKSIRCCLYGITTLHNTRLYSLEATQFIVKFCFNKVHAVDFVKYREEGDFYEIIARRSDGKILNEELVKNSLAKMFNPMEKTKFSIFYPPFELLERSPLYPSYDIKCEFIERGIDWNMIEEELISPNSSFENQFRALLENPKFTEIKEIFNILWGKQML